MPTVHPVPTQEAPPARAGRSAHGKREANSPEAMHVRAWYGVHFVGAQYGIKARGLTLNAHPPSLLPRRTHHSTISPNG